MNDIFYEIFEALPRQGPGSDESTKQAFQKFEGIPEKPEILDIGCGSGAQTLALAKLSKGNITTLDSHVPFLDLLKKRVEESGLSGRVRAIVGDMGALDFADESFDIIWSEGAVFIIGFEIALKSWKSLLKLRGYLVVSDLVWFKKDAPQKIRDFFANINADVKYYEDIFSIANLAGYEVVSYFPLPSDSWWISYYKPLEKLLTQMRQKYESNEEAQSLFDSFQLEIDMFREFSEYYGYGFYVLRKSH